MARVNLHCALCGATPKLVCHAHPGYRQNTAFAIYTCAQCNTSFADPMTVDDRLYDDIYRNAKDIPGYSRYVKYAEVAAAAADPLASLAAVEAAYWGVAQVLNDNPAWTRVLEVGSGYGYLTYAFSQRGLHARGLDISAEAVARARARFGDLYEVSNLDDFYHRPDFEPWDAVVCTELLEHVPDVHTFLESALKLLKPGGSIVMTTPNRSIDAADIVWNTDPPPVHVWWFSEQSLAALAARHDLVLRLVDFSEFNRIRPNFELSRPRGLQPSIIDAEGKSLEKPYQRSALRRFALSLSAVPGMSPIVARLSGRRRITGTRTRTICAVLQKR